jgi:NADPH:quinone reductase-like Zn-dependent oxidoreductase
MESLPSSYSALVREDSEGKEIGLRSFPIPKDIPNEHVLVKVAYAPINPYDWMHFLKKGHGNSEEITPPPFIGGFEGIGTIVDIGADMYMNPKGTKVSFMLDKSKIQFWGGWSEYVLVHKESMTTYANRINLDDIQTDSINSLTVFFMAKLFDPKKERVAVFNDGNSSLCRLAVRYFKDHNIKTIMIVQNNAQVEEVKKEGAHWVINSKDEKYLENLKNVFAEAKPVTFFDAVSGPDAMEIFQAMPNGSTLYNYGALSMKPLSVSPSDLIFRNKTIT